ncbi:YgjV family protein, partial [Shewanella sp. 10N.286.52.B9]
MEAATVWEWVGYLASAVVAISLMMANIKKLRWWNLIGAALFVAYGLAIGAIPVALVNFFIVLIDIYY